MGAMRRFEGMAVADGYEQLKLEVAKDCSFLTIIMLRRCIEQHVKRGCNEASLDYSTLLNDCPFRPREHVWIKFD